MAVAIALTAGFGFLGMFIALGVLAGSGRVETPRTSARAVETAPSKKAEEVVPVSPAPEPGWQDVASGVAH